MGNEVTIDTLQIELETNAKAATSGLDALANTLEKIKSATKGGAGLSAVAKQLESVKTAVTGMNGSSTSGLAKAVLLLRNLGNVKISTNVANQLNKINEVLPKLNVGDGATKIQDLVSALKPLETLGKSSLSTTVNALKKLPEAMEKIDTRKLYTQIQSLTRIMKPLADEMDKVARGFSAFPSRIQKIIAENEKLSASNGKASKSYIDLFAKFKSFASGLKTAVTGMMDLAEGSMEYIETINLVNMSMGEYAERAMEYAKRVENAMGIDPKEWLTGHSVLMSLVSGFGVASDRAYTMSQNLNQLAYDLWSLKGEAQGITLEESFEKVLSGVAGELEPLRAVGYDLSQARLELEAYNLGITKKLANMTQAEKAELRYMAIMRQSSDVIGDMSRTLDSPANQLRIFKSQITQSARALGNLFIPLLNKALPVLNATLRVFRELVAVVTKLFGITLPEANLDGASRGASGISAGMESAAESAKKLKDYTMGFDELNVINPNAGSEGASEEPPTGGGFNFDLPEYDFISDATQTKVNEIVDKMKEWLGITEDIDSWADLFKTRLGGILTLVALVGVGLLAWKVIKVVSDVADVFSKLGIGGKKETGGGDSGGLESAGKTFSGTITTLKNLLKTFALGIAIIAEVIAATLLVVGAIWLLGVMLEQVGIAWQPVIDNGATIAIAIGVGTALLVAIGAATAGLGTLGGAMAGQMGIGIAILAEMGVATGLFLVEIWAIGKALDEIGEAWQPVIDNGETIATGIGIGTGLLVGIGVVTALLGTATVATAGALPLAIGLGTAMLIGLSAAFVLFTDSLVDVANKLSEDLHPALESTSAILPDLTTNMSEFTSFMAGFAGEVVKYSVSSAIAGIAATIDTIIGFFTTDPVTKMANEVDSQNEEFDHLLSGLKIIIPKIEEATELVNQYNSAMGTFEEASGNNKGLLGSLGIVKSAINNIISGIESLANGVIKGINGMINALNKLSFDIPDWVPGIGGEKFGLNLKTINTITIPRFAEGGFPETGQMFIAREAGAEMVGSIGRRTAVANNDQIVAGITSGVADANAESNTLLREQNSLLKALLDKETGTYIDGRKLSKELDRVNKGRGVRIIAGGAY